MQLEYTSDIGQSKRILPSNFNLEPTAMSFSEQATPIRDHRQPKYYTKTRPSSVPRIYMADTSSWRNYDLPNYCPTEFRRSPAIYIEQDIINKQRQEIQLLMEELSNRDQELNDLVVSHQKQVKVWECDNEKQKALHARLSLFEDELMSKEEQLKKTLENMAQIKDQSEVDALELNRTHDEMIKLTEKIMENSEYIQEIEDQNNKLNMSMRDFLDARQAFSVREQELLCCLKEKDMQLADKEQDNKKLADHIKYLECQCQELGERNNNMTEESVNWKNRFSEMKEEVEKLSDDCIKKEENLHKMTHQLHEALQQAIALQKALFISCEREKCKEEVMFSLRKQHKRTMQELQNTRELYDRLSRDTIYQLNMKEKDGVGEIKRKEEEEVGKRKIDDRQDQEVDKWHQENRRKMNSNCLHKSKQPEVSEDNPTAKEKMKERKSALMEGKIMLDSRDMNTKNNLEKDAGKCENKRQNFSAQADIVKVVDSGLKSSAKDRHAHQCVPTVLRNPPSDSEPFRSGHTMYRGTQTPTNNVATFVDESGFARPASSRPDFRDSSTQVQSTVFGNSSRNADVIDSVSNSCSQFGELSCKTEQPQASSLVSLHDALEDSSLKITDVEKCNPQQEANSARCPSQIYKNTPSHVDLSRNIDFSNVENGKNPNQPIADSEATTTHKQYSQKRTGQSDSKEPPKGSFSIPDFEVYSPTHVGRNCSSAMNNLPSQSMHLQSRNVSKNPRGNSPEGKGEHRRASSIDKQEVAISGISNSSDTGRVQDGDRYQQFTNESNNEQQNSNKDCQHFNFGKDHMNRISVGENQLYLWHEPCDQCRARGRQCCNCPPAQTSNKAPCLKTTTGTFDVDVAKSGVNYAPQIKSTMQTSKVSFNDVTSCSEHETSSEDHMKPGFRNLGKGNQVSQKDIDNPMRNVIHPPFHLVNRKINTSYPFSGPYQSQGSNSFKHKVSLPDKVSTYLEQQHPIRRDEYYNNNNRFDCHLVNFEPKSDFPTSQEPDTENQPSNGENSLRFTSWNEQIVYAKSVQTFLPNEDSPRFFWGTEKMREVQKKYELLPSERREGMPFDGRENFGDRDNNNNRTEFVYSDPAVFCNVKDNAVLNAKTGINYGGNVKTEGNIRLKDKDDRVGNVKDNGNATLDVKGVDHARFDMRVKDIAKGKVVDKLSTTTDVKAVDNARTNVKGTNNFTSNMMATNNARADGKSKDNNIMNVNSEDNSRIDTKCCDNDINNVEDRDNFKLNINGTDGVIKNDMAKDTVKSDVKSKDNARLDVKSKDKSVLDVIDKDSARLEVKSKDNARLDVKSNDNARSDVNSKDKSILDVIDKDNARLDVKVQNNARLDVKSKDNARLDVKSKDNARLDVNSKDKSILGVIDKDNARLDVKSKDNTRLDVKGKDKIKLNVIDKGNARLDVKVQNNARLVVKSLDNARLDVKGKDKIKLNVIDKDNARLDAIEDSGFNVKSHLFNTQRSSFLQKAVIFSSVDRLELRQKQILSTQTSIKSSIEDSVDKSFFFPEESDSENDTQVHILPSKGNVVGSSLNASVMSSGFHFPSKRNSTFLHKHFSQIHHTEKLQQKAQTVPPQ